MTTVGWQALGTSAVLAVGEARHAEAARAIVELELDRIDRACSRFRADSELSRVNAAAGSWVHVGCLLFDAMELALRAAEITDGAVDPTVGQALERAGYDRDFSLLAPETASEASLPASPVGEVSSSSLPMKAGDDRPSVRLRPRSGWRAVEVDRRSNALRIPRGVKLDLGASAKAWAADRASRAVHEQLGCGVLVSLGGDISTRGAAPIGGWQVHVTDDHRAGPGAPGQRIAIRGGGLATSSVMARRWTQGGRAMHHIIDPSSGEPTRGPWRTVSVAAIDCTDANIASTAALVLGEHAIEWLRGLGVPARLVDYAGGVHTMGGWPAESGPAVVPTASCSARSRGAQTRTPLRAGVTA